MFLQKCAIFFTSKQIMEDLVWNKRGGKEEKEESGRSPVCELILRQHVDTPLQVPHLQ